MIRENIIVNWIKQCFRYAGFHIIDWMLTSDL